MLKIYADEHSKNLDWESFATEIDRILSGKESINEELLRVNRPTNPI